MGIGTRLLEEIIRAISGNPNLRKIKLAVNSPQTVAASIYGNSGLEWRVYLRKRFLLT